MWPEHTKSGKVQFREYYIDPLTGKKKTVSITYNKHTRKTEQEALIMLQKKIEEKLADSNKKVTFKELSEKWLPIYKKQVKTSTYYNNVTYLKQFNRVIGDVLLDNLTSAHINNITLDLFEKDYRYDTVRGMVSSVKSVLKFGKKYGYLVDNSILEGIHIPKINLPNKEERRTYKYLEHEELSSVIEQLEEVNHHEVARMCLLQVSTGLRHGELISIDYKKHIDFKERTLLIERTWYHRKRMFQTPKSGHSRTIYFNEQTERLLREQIQFARIKVLQNGLDATNHLLFTNLQNEPFTNSYTNEVLARHVEIKNKNVRTHIFRHTFIAYMLEKGTNVKLIAEHVGHTDTQMIQSFYDHFTERMNEELKETINDFSIEL